jgi:hypothetical protein
MDGQAFINQIIDYYQESRKLTVETQGFNIWRGVSHSISSLSEDLFALMVAQEINDKSLEFIVDKTFTLRKKDNTSVQFRPDLAIVKNNEIRVIVDLKMDMGYKRRYNETEAFQKEAEKFELLRSAKYKDITYSQKKSSISLTASRSITNRIVVVSEKNEGKAENRESMVEEIGKLNWVDMYYLSGGVHPNAYDASTLSQLVVNQDAFDCLCADIKGALA